MPNGSKLAVQWTVLAIFVLVLFAVIAVGYTAIALPACESCHLSDKTFARDTEASPHASVACARCHVGITVGGRISFASREVFHMWLGVADADRSAAFVPSERCASCHEEVTKPVTLGSKGLRIKHSSCAAGSTCTECHSITAHGPSTSWPRTARMEDCYDCHGKTVKITKCDACHAERSERQRISSGTFRVTHGAQWQKTHGMGDMQSCSACHEASKCAGCHGAGVPHTGDFRTTHAKFSTQKSAKCTTCHRESFCNDCHAYAMPHTEKFVLGHAAVVDKDTDKGCLTCHAEADCISCHVSHVHPVTQEQMDGFMLKRGAR